MSDRQKTTVYRREIKCSEGHVAAYEFSMDLSPKMLSRDKRIHFDTRCHECGGVVEISAGFDNVIGWTGEQIVTLGAGGARLVRPVRGAMTLAMDAARELLLALEPAPEDEET